MYTHIFLLSQEIYDITKSPKITVDSMIVFTPNEPLQEIELLIKLGHNINDISPEVSTKLRNLRRMGLRQQHNHNRIIGAYNIKSDVELSRFEIECYITHLSPKKAKQFYKDYKVYI